MTEAMKLKLSQRAKALFEEQSNLNHSKTDRLFGVLLVFEYIAGILVASLVSPNVWAGQYSGVHIHVWTSIILGGLIVFWPICLAVRFPGRTITRHVIAVAQMLYSALLIHLTGGRIETHFHVFGSLAFLGFYRDWRVILTATIIVASDHVLRGIFNPQSVYGVAAIEPWRWLEHSWWVIFEDFFLINACLENSSEMKQNAFRQAEVEITRDSVEDLVCERTKQLRLSELRVATQLAATKTLSDAGSLKEAAPLLLGRIADGMFHNVGLVCGAMWEVDNETDQLKQISEIQLSSSGVSGQRLAPVETAYRFDDLRLAQRALQSHVIVQQSHSLSSPSADGYGTALAIPIIAGEQVCGVFEFCIQESIELNELEVALLNSIAQQIGQFTVRRRIEHNNKQLAHIVQSSREAIIGETLDGVITSWNAGAEQLLGYSLADVNGKSETILAPELGVEEFAQQIQAVANRKEGENVETTRVRKDGREVDVSMVRCPVYDEYNRVVGISVFMRDITEKKEAEKRVSEFYSIVSHELRTPLTSIRGALGLIEGGIITPDSPQMMELVTVARTSSDRLIRLINDMLDLKKIEAGKMEMTKVQISAHEIVEATVNSLSGMAQETGVTIQCDVASDATVQGDWDKLTQVLTNLGSNAIKFSPSGGMVTFNAQVKDSNLVRFAISDQGCGIADEHKDKLFEKFQQIDSSDTRAKGGTGLGLAICKALVIQHGGTLGFDSTVGEGSTFWFELPLHTKKLAPTESSPAISDKGSGHVLLVEDDNELAVVIGAVIEQQGYRFTRAATLSQAREMLSDMIPDVVILDLTLPDGSGLDFLEHLRSNPRTVDVPVIVSTGQQMEQKTVGSATIVDWLLKPFDNSRLTSSVERALRYPGKCKVLVVDDDSDTRVVLSAQLRAAGLDCIEAKDGLEAIYLTRKEAPDLIVLDVQMPHVDGFQVVQVLKNEAARSTPLVIYSGRDLSAGERDSLTLGVTKHLMKGQSQWELSSAINELLAGVTKKNEEARPVADPATDSKILVNAGPK